MNPKEFYNSIINNIPPGTKFSISGQYLIIVNKDYSPRYLDIEEFLKNGKKVDFKDLEELKH